jgi:SagB-type dehydrogenase family enzyme
MEKYVYLAKELHMINAKIMKTISIVTLYLVLISILFSQTFAQELKPIQLPKPQMDGGRPLMQVLKDRSSSREFSSQKLPLQVLSNLLWAASGINRSDSGKRTAPSAANWQEIDIYVATAEGLYLYDAKPHLLKPVLAQDIRALTGRQAFVKEAALNLIYVADFSRIGRGTNEEKDFFSAADTGFIAQNVYLFCASEGLATVVRANIDREPLAKTMKLRPEQKITLSQTVGYPKK